MVAFKSLIFLVLMYDYSERWCLGAGVVYIMLILICLKIEAM